MSQRESQLQLLALAQKQLLANKLQNAFSPEDPDSRPTVEQDRAFRAVADHSFIDISGGNQCLRGSSEISMADGTVKQIKDILVGDLVLTFDTKTKSLVPSTVIKTHHNGPKPVVAYVTEKGDLVCTPNHKVLQKRGRKFSKRAIDSCDYLLALSGISPIVLTASVSKEEPVYDITVDHPDHNYIANGFIVSNSGKSQWTARNLAWFCSRNHPYVDVEKRWPNQRILCLLLAQSTKLYEEHWEQRIKPFFDKNDWVPKVQGGILQSISFPKFNSKILFFSYENVKQARNRLQGFTGMVVAIDELCNSVGVYEEAERRVQRNNGVVIASYTQKVRAPAVRKYIKAPSPYKAHFILNTFDNPSYDDEAKAKIEASIAQFSPDVREIKRKQILEGDYTDDDEYAYSYDRDLHGCGWPDNYSKSWRHIEVIDPAASGKAGWMILAEDPDRDVIDRNGKVQAVWYVVDSKYIPGEAPSDLVAATFKESEPYNIVRRVADGHETWFIKEARKPPFNLSYHTPLKDNRKVELIKAPSEALKDGWLKVIDDGTSNELLLNEFGDAIWKPDGSGIKGSTRFHLLDTLQYGVDKRPPRDEEHKPMTPGQVLYLANKKRKQHEVAREKAANLRIRRKRRRHR